MIQNMSLQNTPDNSNNEAMSSTALLQMIRSYRVSQCIYIAAKLGIADLLKDGEQHCHALAAATNTDRLSLYRILRALASVGLFAESQPYYFKLTPLATYLQSDSTTSLRAYAILLGEEHYQVWGNLMYSVQTGQNAFEPQHGMGFYEFFQQNPTPGAIFDRAMTDLSSVDNTAILAAYDFSGIGTLVDVGGGNGRLLSSILAAYDRMQGILFERPDVIERSVTILEDTGIQDRLQLVKGDFFQGISSEGKRNTAYMLKHILHNWGDEQAIAILQNCDRAMAEDGLLLVIEIVIPPGNDPSPGKFMDINMLVNFQGGQERTKAEYAALLKAAGFKLTQIIPTESEVSIIEAVKNYNDYAG